MCGQVHIFGTKTANKQTPCGYLIETKCRSNETLPLSILVYVTRPCVRARCFRIFAFTKYSPSVNYDSVKLALLRQVVWENPSDRKTKRIIGNTISVSSDDISLCPQYLREDLVPTGRLLCICCLVRVFKTFLRCPFFIRIFWQHITS